MLSAAVMRVCKIVHPLRGTRSRNHKFQIRSHNAVNPRKFLAELKRRNFYKVAIACAVGFGDLVRDSFRQVEK
jgi:hypothetical protein